MEKRYLTWQRTQGRWLLVLGSRHCNVRRRAAAREPRCHRKRAFLRCELLSPFSCVIRHASREQWDVSGFTGLSSCCRGLRGLRGLWRAGGQALGLPNESTAFVPLHSRRRFSICTLLAFRKPIPNYEQHRQTTLKRSDTRVHLHSHENEAPFPWWFEAALQWWKRQAGSKFTARVTCELGANLVRLISIYLSHSHWCQSTTVLKYHSPKHMG